MIDLMLLTAALLAPPTATPAQFKQVEAWSQAAAKFHPLSTAQTSAPRALVTIATLHPAKMNAENLLLDGKGLRGLDGAANTPLVSAPTSDERPVLTIAPGVQAASVLAALKTIHTAGQAQVILLVKPATPPTLPPSLNAALTRKVRQTLGKLSGAARTTASAQALTQAMTGCEDLAMTMQMLSSPAIPPKMRGQMLMRGTVVAAKACPAQPVFDFTAVLTGTISEDVSVGIELTLDPHATPLVVSKDATWQSFADAVATHQGPFWIAVK